MKWHSLNQYYVIMESQDSRITVIEDLVSSEQQWVLLLMSGTVSPKTMNLLGRGHLFYNRTDHRGLL